MSAVDGKAIVNLIGTAAETAIEMCVLSELAEARGEDILCIRIIDAASALSEATKAAMKALKDSDSPTGDASA